jgi:predicted unusual protein kinase regulating ubiquinone biosynthesis (AarF/ABC1/UbiB family)
MLDRSRPYRTNGTDLVLAYDPRAQTSPAPVNGSRKSNVLREYLTASRRRQAKPKQRHIAQRLLVLIYLVILWYVAAGLDRLSARGRAQASTRGARRMRRYIERAGGTLIKLGQQASLRSDLFSEEYCRQLASLLDRHQAFDVSEAYKAIERLTGACWQDTFALIVSEPVGSASIGCVFRGVLHNGHEVAIKVRRPGIDRAFTTDLAALGLLGQALEFFTFIAPGLLDSFVSELRTMLLDELDFRGEVRRQELFRRFLAERKKLNVTAPKLYYELCGYDVIVSEFITGFWMNEIIARIDAQDHGYMAMLRNCGIKPHQIAKRLIRSQYYQFHECPFFHGDPHPGNIVVRPGGQIVMVDFGACGVFSARDRNLMLRMHYHYSKGDVAGMVHCVLGLMEPMPQIDVDAFSKHLQDQWWKGYYGIKSHHADWSERTSFRLWVALLEGFREHSIPMPLQMIRMVRATLLYDTVAAQLYAKINVFHEFEKYYNGVARRVRIDMQESMIRQALIGPDDMAYVTAKRIVDIGNALLFRAEKFLAEPEISFEAGLRKLYMFFDAVAQTFKSVAIFLLVSVAAAAALLGARQLLSMACNLRPSWRGCVAPPKWWELLNTVTPWRGMPDDPLLQAVLYVWIVFAVLVAWSHACRTLARFNRKDNYAFQHRVG